MSDKKDIFDYLRNRQKAAEIEAKVNGVNLWVLLGAMGVIAWQLTGRIDFEFRSHSELVLRALLASEALYLFGWVCSSVGSVRAELRYSSWRAREIESPLLILVEGAWILLPPALFIMLIGGGKSVYLLVAFGLILVGMSVAAIWSRLMMREGPAEERFPKPEFEQTARSDAIGFLVVAACHVFVAAVQLQALCALAAPSIELVKSTVLVAAFYLLVLMAIRRHRSSQKIRWTYELETDLLVGSLSPEAAVRRIEHRALGPKLEDVMNRFFEGLDLKIAEFDALMKECEQKIALSVNAIPQEYKLERSGRVQDVTAATKQKLDELTLDIGQFVDYLEKLSLKKSDPRVKAVIKNLVMQGKAYNKRIRESHSRLQSLINRHS